MESQIEQFQKLIFRLFKSTRRDLEHELSEKKIGLTFLQFGVLRILEHETKTLNDIAQLMTLKPPTLIPVIDYLEQKKLIERHKDVHDRRKIQLSITKKAKDILQVISSVKSKSLQKALTPLGKEKLQQLLDLLELVNNKIT